MGVNDICSSCLLLILVPVNPSPDISFSPSQPSLPSIRPNLLLFFHVPTFSPFYLSQPSLTSIRLSFYPPQPYLLLSVETFTSCILPNLLCFFPRPNFLYFYLSLPYIFLSVSIFFPFYPSQPLFWLTLFLLPSLFYTIPVFLPGRSWLTLFSS